MSLNDTMETARHTIAQMDSLLARAREQLGRCACPLGDGTMSAASISAFVADQDEAFQRAYAAELAALNHILPAPESMSRLALQPVSTERATR
ncbi:MULTISPECIES: hypothetical protein [Bradyrhizobium]|uniref:Uncharacterized protein n=1 Tax=Bradyrhizobium frederickii TaxID=2560054 RepID=A0A4Y9KRY8_9BRAD|nr:MULTISPECIES: hypothetical protein [Bradyrhizobium]TFV29486.1 hypothetical protein E4K66_37565 [Bradyrhizobium frederickii]TFV68049.1 hypothetical protein E4K64_37585 [Bradyrhizobium frederickii]